MRIYCAGPYSDNPQPNTDRACVVAGDLIDLGHTPYVPHLSHYIELLHSFPYETWMRLDLEWLRLCDALYLIAPSPGANREVAAAEAIGLPIYRSLQEVPHA